MIEVLVDPCVDHALNLGEVHHHAAFVELRLSNDGGATFQYVLSSALNDNSAHVHDVSGFPDGTAWRARVVPFDGRGGEGAPVISAANFTIDNTPRVVAARYEDANRNAVVDAGDRLVLRFNMDVTLTGLTAANVQLPST